MGISRRTHDRHQDEIATTPSASRNDTAEDGIEHQRRDGKPVPYTLRHRKTLIYNGLRACPRTFRFHDRKITRRPSRLCHREGADTPAAGGG